MEHWAQKYVGLNYTEDQDCAWLINHVLKKETEMDIRLPCGMDWRKAKPSDVQEIAKEFAEEVQKPQCFDGVLMRIQGNRRSRGSHIGLYAPFQEQSWVLHTVEKIGCIWTPLPFLVRMNLEVMGYYRWKFDLN